jgi:hypothetical protein
VPGLRVWLYGIGGEIANAFTNQDGVARFDPVPYGNWGVYVDPPDSLGTPSAPRVHVDGLGMEAGIVLTPRLAINRCAGALNVEVVDQDTIPVPNYAVQLYTFVGAYAYAATTASGPAVFTGVTCGNYGVLAEPTAGYSVDFTVGSGVQDGLNVTNAGTINTRVFVTRNPPE